MTERELTGKYRPLPIDSDAYYERWRRQIADIEIDLNRFPEQLFDDAGRTGIYQTPEGRAVAAYLLGDFRDAPGGEPHLTRLYVGIDQDASNFRLYEHGPSQVTLDRNGEVIRDNPVALRELSLDTLVPSELDLAKDRLQPYVAPVE